MDASDYQSFLMPTTYSHLRECCFALDEQQFFASAVWGAVFLEAFLGDLAAQLGIPAPSQPELGGRIGQLRQYSKNHSPQKPDVPSEIINRCEEIRNTRNRLVHDMGLPKSTLQHDAKSIAGAIKVILDWYRTISGEAELGRVEDSDAADSNDGVPVFISAAGPHTQRQKHFLETLNAKLRKLGIRPVRLVPSIYDKADPIGAVQRTPASCKGIVVIGLERSHAYFLRDKEGSEKQQEETHRKYTSGWLHLEAGIAHALGLEVYVLCERAIYSDGIFDRDWNTYPVNELPSQDEDSDELQLFFSKIASWAKQQAGNTASDRR